MTVEPPRAVRSTEGGEQADPAIEMSSLGAGWWEWDLNHREVRWSRELRVIYGIPEDEKPEMTLEAFSRSIHPEDRARVMAVVSETMATERERHEHRFRIVRPDGSVRQIMSRVRLVRDADGRPIRWQGLDVDLTEGLYAASTDWPTIRQATETADQTATDGDGLGISERRALELRLEESETRFRTMADELPLIVWLHDADGRQVFVNQTFCDYFGATREEMHDERWQLFTHPDDGDGYSQAFAAAVREQQPFHAEVRVRRADGKWRWLESWGRPFRDALGRVAGFVGASADVSERKAAEEATSASESRLRDVLESINDGIMVVDPDWTVSFISRRGEDLVRPLGLSRDTIVGARLWDAFPGLTATPFEDAYREAMDRQEARSLEAYWSLLDTWFDVRVYPRAEGGLSLFYLDVGERKRTEQKLDILVQELNHRVRNAMAMVTSIVHHTFRNTEADEALIRTLLGRINAVAAAHELLFERSWQDAELGALARRVLLQAVGADRLTLSGPEVPVAPATAVTFTLAFHELCTNAMKYGALSVPEGHVDLHWSVPEKDQGSLEIVWRERGGPPVLAAPNRGFGLRMIEMTIGQSMGGSVDVQLAPEGLCCVIRTGI
jgi:PAS domain S-box-containing protein